MGIESATERAIFFNTDDFGVASTYTLDGGASSTINGIFDNEFLEVDPMSGVGVVTSQPRFILGTSTLPSGYATGDGININSTAYTIRAIQHEGTGLTTLVLEKN